MLQQVSLKQPMGGGVVNQFDRPKRGQGCWVQLSEGDGLELDTWIWTLSSNDGFCLRQLVSKANGDIYE